MFTVSIPCFARFGYQFRNYSLLVGQQYRPGQGPLWSCAFQYDRFSISCTKQKRYKGIEANYAWNHKYSEIVISGKWNPTLMSVFLSKSSILLPYIFGQGTYMQSNEATPVNYVNKVNRTYHFRPGIGVNGIFRDNNVINVRIGLQLGYTLPFYAAQNFKKPWTLELKIGLGFNPRHFRLNKNKKSKKVV